MFQRRFKTFWRRTCNHDSYRDCRPCNHQDHTMISLWSSWMKSRHTITQSYMYVVCTKHIQS